jgi:hypothetical protein
MSPRISSPVTAPRGTGLTHPCPHDDHVKSRSIREELRNRRKMPTRHFSPKQALIADDGPRVRTRAGRGCRSHGLCSVSFIDCWRLGRKGCVPAPLTLRMMERVWSSMNSTRHWVTPPREPVSPLACVYCIFPCSKSCSLQLCSCFLLFLVRCRMPQCGDRVPVRPRTRVTLTSLTGALAVSIV